MVRYRHVNRASFPIPYPISHDHFADGGRHDFMERFFLLDGIQRECRPASAGAIGPAAGIEIEGTESPILLGTILNQSERWIVVQPLRDPSAPNTPTNPTWIPRERVMMIEVRR
jgi:hypothetical protein